ncbi:7065_t:CDS:2, partial [Ambispora leptoticha]
VDVPLRVDKSIDILEMLKLAVCTFDQATIALGSSRAYKRSTHLRVNSEPNAKVPRESVYDSEICRVLQNWLKIINNFRVTGQWHLEQVGEDGWYRRKSLLACKQLLERGLNVVHFWHNKEFKNVRMSVKSRDATGNFNIIINEQILP